MKKIVSILTAFVLSLALLLPMTVSAEGEGVGWGGPGVVRAGDTITLWFSISGNGIYGASGTLSYDSSQVTLEKTAQKIASPWAVEFNGNNFVAYDNNLSNPINNDTYLFTATFKVKSIPVGTELKISCTNVKISDGNTDKNLGSISFLTTIAAPMSTDNNLASLNVSNATISPAFSANTTNYTANVPFEVSKLNVTATAADSKATVSVNSPNLVPNGTTKVTVTVTAENGAKKVYTISVKREQDPNYQASGNNNLKNITVDGFLLSPVFDSSTTKYVVWLPYETTSIRVSGTPQDSKASVEVVGGDNLAAGQDNPIKVICTAENGDKKEYVVVAKRAAAHDASVESTPDDPVSSEPPVSDVESDIVTSTESEEISSEATSTVTSDGDATSSQGGIAWWWLIVVGGAALALGFVVGMVSKKK